MAYNELFKEIWFANLSLNEVFHMRVSRTCMHARNTCKTNGSISLPSGYTEIQYADMYLCVLLCRSVCLHMCNEWPLPHGCQHIFIIYNPAVSPQAPVQALLSQLHFWLHASCLGVSSGQLACKPGWFVFTLLNPHCAATLVHTLQPSTELYV